MKRVFYHILWKVNYISIELLKYFCLEYHLRLPELLYQKDEVRRGGGGGRGRMRGERGKRRKK